MKLSIVFAVVLMLHATVVANDFSRRWVPTKPNKVVLSSPGSSKILKDGSVQFDGSDRWQEFTLYFGPSDLPSEIQTMRLELLPRVPLPSGSRKPVMLFDVKPHLKDNAGNTTQLEFAECSVVGNPNDDSAANCIDFLSDTGWKVPELSKKGSSRQLQMRFAEPIALDDTSMFGVTIDSGGSPTLDTLSRVRVLFPLDDPAKTPDGTNANHEYTISVEGTQGVKLRMLLVSKASATTVPKRQSKTITVPFETTFTASSYYVWFDSLDNAANAGVEGRVTGSIKIDGERQGGGFGGTIKEGNKKTFSFGNL